MIYGNYGISLYDRLFLEALSSFFDIYLVTFSEPTQVPAGVHIVRLPDFGRPSNIRKINNLRMIVAALFRIIMFRFCAKCIEPDVVVGNIVQTYGLYSSLSGCKPFVLFAYGTDILIDAYRSFLHRFISSRIVRSADLVLVDSEVQRRAVRSLGCSPQKIISFPWVDIKQLQGVKRDQSIRTLLGWRHMPVVVSVRKLEPVYAVETLIRAIPAVVTQYPNARFLVFGDGSQSAHLTTLARELSVDSYIHFAGKYPRSSLLRYLQDCDVYVSTSVSDGCSSSLLEAMYLGIPVVVTSIPGNTEWIADRVSGLTFDKQDSGALAAAIVWLLAHPNEALRLSRIANELVSKRVNWDEAIRELVGRIYGVTAAIKKEEDLFTFV